MPAEVTINGKPAQLSENQRGGDRVRIGKNITARKGSKPARDFVKRTLPARLQAQKQRQQEEDFQGDLQQRQLEFLDQLQGFMDEGAEQRRAAQAEQRGMRDPQLEAARQAQGQQAAARAQQQDLVRMLQAQARGEGPSIAQQQLRMATDRAIAQQAALAASGRGSPALARRQASIAGTALAGQQAGQSALLRAQEQLGARAQLEGALRNIRGQDVAAGSAQQAALSGVRGQDLQAAGLGAALQQAAGQQTGANLANQLSFLAQLRGQDIQRELGQGQLDAGRRAQDFQLIGAGASAAGALLPLLLSDATTKENIKPGSKETEDFLSALEAKTYEYKAGHKAEGGSGQKLGILAQDLEKSELGKQLVQQGEDGLKRIDVGSGFGALLAAAADLHRRVKKLEK